MVLTVDEAELAEIAATKRNIAARIAEDHKRKIAAENVRPDKPKKRPPGPEPTLGAMARQEAGWLFLTCPAWGCHHRVAAHLAIFEQMLGADCTMTDFRARLWCTKCGRLNCSTYAQSWLGSREATEAFPEHQSYYTHMEKLDREGALSFLVIDRRTNKIRRDRLTSAQAQNATLRYNRRGGSFEAMHFDRWRMIVAQRST